MEDSSMMREDQNGGLVFDALLWTNSKKRETQGKPKKQQGMHMAQLLAKSHGNQMLVIEGERGF